MKNITALALLLLMSVSAFAEVSPSERKALLKLYKSTNGKEW